MGKLFGTDGVRGIVNDNLTISLAMKIGVSVTRKIRERSSKPVFLVGTDTRVSRDALKMALISGALGEGADILDLGIIPTPAVSYLIQKYKADGGFVISASHNPSQYNGIKVFNEKGYKLDDDIEEDIENIIFNDFRLSTRVNEVGTYTYLSSAKEDYVNYLLSTVHGDFSSFNICVDTANGGSYETAKMLFSALKVKAHFINDNPDGYNINKNAGSTNLKALSDYVVSHNLDFGIAFDGDADRCLFVDSSGREVNGDKVLAIYGLYLYKSNRLKGNTVVGTVMSNLGLVKFFEKNNISFVKTKVGDRYVLEEMLKNDYIIGGEQSGHTIFREHANTGDGELTAIKILEVLVNMNTSFEVASSLYEDYPQVLKNIEVSSSFKQSYTSNQNVLNVIKEATNILGNDGRVLVRASGTENLIRVMIEGMDNALITNLCDKIVNVIKNELN